ncbi:hypothetical protein Trydic_g1699 [Trypoxylus dichotomus]
MNTVTFNNLHASINNGDIQNVEIVHYRTGNFLSITTYAPGIPTVMILLNNITIDSTKVDEVLIEDNNGVRLRIIFTTAEEKVFFLNEIESDQLSSASGSTDSEP